MISTLIFDLDGLLADTEKLHYESYAISLGGLGIEIDEDFYNAHWIRDGLKIDDFVALRKLPHEPKFLRDRKMIVYSQLVRDRLEAMPGAHDALRRFAPHYRMVLATSAYADAANVVVDTMGIRSYFEAIVTARDVVRYKPDPEPFLLAASRVGVLPEECVVIEDAEKGIVAAYRAGMKSIAIPNRHTRFNDFSLATTVLGSLQDLTLELVQAL